MVKTQHFKNMHLPLAPSQGNLIRIFVFVFTLENLGWNSMSWNESITAFFDGKKTSGTCKMFALNLRTHIITCVVSVRSVSSQINAPTLPEQQLLSFLFPPAPSALPDSRSVCVLVFGRCREFAIPFGSGAVYPCQVGIRHCPKVQHASFCRLPRRHQRFLTRAMSTYRFLASAGNSPFRSATARFTRVKSASDTAPRSSTHHFVVCPTSSASWLAQCPRIDFWPLPGIRHSVRQRRARPAGS